MRIFPSKFHNNFLLSLFNFKLRNSTAAASSKCSYCDLEIFLWLHYTLNSFLTSVLS